MEKTTCQYCKWEPGKTHEDGCPNCAVEAWKRGLKDAVSGMSQAEPGSNSYLLGYANGRVALVDAAQQLHRLHRHHDDH